MLPTMPERKPAAQQAPATMTEGAMDSKQHRRASELGLWKLKALTILKERASRAFISCVVELRRQGAEVKMESTFILTSTRDGLEDMLGLEGIELAEGGLEKLGCMASDSIVLAGKAGDDFLISMGGNSVSVYRTELPFRIAHSSFAIAADLEACDRSLENYKTSAAELHERTERLGLECLVHGYSNVADYLRIQLGVEKLRRKNTGMARAAPVA
jgi:hypothetical protein